MRYVVGAFGKERTAVYPEVEVAPQLVRLVDELDGAYPRLVAAARQWFAPFREGYLHVVEVSLAPAVGLPQFRVSHLGRQGDAIFARLQGVFPAPAGHFASSMGEGEAHLDRFDGAAVFVDDEQVGREFGPVVVDVQGAGEGIVNAESVVEEQPGRTPNTATHQADTPVPPVVVGGFAGIDTQVGRAAVVVGGVVDTRLPVYRFDRFERRCKVDGQGVFARDEQRLHLLLPGHEHVVGLHDWLPVQEDAGKGVESLEDEAGMGVSLTGGAVDGKGSRVAPVLLLDPFHLLLVLSVERVVEQPVAQQVGMHRARHRGGIGAGFSFGTEAPPLVERYHTGVVEVLRKGRLHEEQEDYQ